MIARLLFGGPPWRVGYSEGSPATGTPERRGEEYGSSSTRLARILCRVLGHRYRYVTPTHNCHCSRCQACHCRERR